MPTDGPLTHVPSSTANGNTTTDETGKTYVYDAWDRLVEVKSGPDTLLRYTYDGLGRRTTREDTAASRKAVYYYNDRWQVVEEQVGFSSDWASSGSTNSKIVKSQYVWSEAYIDAMVLRDHDTDNNKSTGQLGKPGHANATGLDERLYAAHDANFNVTALVGANGLVVERYRYDVYGAVTFLNADFTPRTGNASGKEWVHLFQGGRLETVTGNFHFRHRDYRPTLGRPLQQDPIGYADGANLYLWEGSSPVNHLDPTGLRYDNELHEVLPPRGPPRPPEGPPRPTSATARKLWEEVKGLFCDYVEWTEGNRKWVDENAPIVSDIIRGAELSGGGRGGVAVGMVRRGGAAAAARGQPYLPGLRPPMRPPAPAPKRGGMGPNAACDSAEDAVAKDLGIPRNNGRGGTPRETIPAPSGKTDHRVPDFPPSKTAPHVVEVKGGSTEPLYGSSQLKDDLTFAESGGGKLVICTNRPVAESGWLPDMIKAGRVIIRPIPPSRGGGIPGLTPVPKP